MPSGNDVTARPPVDPRVPAPEAALGFQLGQRAAYSHEIASYLTRLVAASDRALLHEYGTTAGGRKLLCLVISSPANLARLSELHESLRRLACEPLSDAAARELGAHLPAVAWMGYGIHGDEISGPDAAMELAYRLCAGADEHTRRLLDQLVIYIDPLANPDGRERFLAHTGAFARTVSAQDVQDLLHTQLWPTGRGNHYLFDLNRDAIFTVQEQSRARVQAIIRSQAQLYVDAHEMSATDTYLFAVPAQPLNPHLPSDVQSSWSEIGADLSAALDDAGLSYYTRSWNEVFYPGFFDIWPAYRGAVPVLYEQAATSGTTVRLANGKQRTYREAIINQVRSSLVNLQTAALRRSQLLDRWRTAHRTQAHAPLEQAAWLVLPSDCFKASRIRRLLHVQGIRVEQLTGLSPSEVDLYGPWSETPQRVALPPGTLMVRTAQPLAALIRNIFDFHVPMDPAFIERERRAIDLGQGSLLYDATAWSVPLAFGADAGWVRSIPAGEWSLVETHEVAAHAPRALRPGRYGYILRDPSLFATLRLLARGVRLRVAEEEFTHDGTRYERGTLLVRNDDQDQDAAAAMEKAGTFADAVAAAVDSARIHDGPDLGGREFRLLSLPRIAILGGSLADAACTGALWHLFDAEIGLPVSLLDLARLAALDLSAYDVIVVPDTTDRADLVALLENRIRRLRAWVEGGGTLIGLAGGALALADCAITAAKPRRSVIAKFPPMLFGRKLKDVIAEDFTHADGSCVHAGAAGAASRPVVGAAARKFLPPGAETFQVRSAMPAVDERLAREPAADERWSEFIGEHIRKYLPRGAYLRADLRPRHWLRYGAADRLPVLFRESDTLLCAGGAEVVGRYSAAADLALSGLIWPEAVGYIAGTAYLTRERMGAGQLILFTNDPVFRGYSLGTQRLFLNAAVFGPAFRTA